MNKDLDSIIRNQMIGMFRALGSQQKGLTRQARKIKWLKHRLQQSQNQIGVGKNTQAVGSYSDDVAASLAEISDISDYAAKLMRESAMILSGKISESDFLRRVGRIKNAWKNRQPANTASLPEDKT